MTIPPRDASAARRVARRAAPAAAFLVLAGALVAAGVLDAVRLETLALRRAALDALVVDRPALAILLYVALYVVVVAAFLPGAGVLSLAGGALFGARLGPVVVYLAAGASSTVAFLVARSALGGLLQRRAGSRLARVAEAFRREAFGYLLFLRLVPLFPFWFVNLAPAALGVPMWTYVRATLIGMLPASVAFALAGAGLDSVLRAQGAALAACRAAAADPGACRLALDARTVLTPEMTAGLVGLGLLALVPGLARRLRGRDRAATSPAA